MSKTADSAFFRCAAAAAGGHSMNWQFEQKVAQSYYKVAQNSANFE